VRSTGLAVWIARLTIVCVQKEFKSPDDVPSEDIEEIAALLKDSEAVEISEDGFQIRRKNVCFLRHLTGAVASVFKNVSSSARVKRHTVTQLQSTLGNGSEQPATPVACTVRIINRGIAKY
jgi:hypothetical protein